MVVKPYKIKTQIRIVFQSTLCVRSIQHCERTHLYRWGKCLYYKRTQQPSRWCLIQTTEIVFTRYLTCICFENKVKRGFNIFNRLNEANDTISWYIGKFQQNYLKSTNMKREIQSNYDMAELPTWKLNLQGQIQHFVRDNRYLSGTPILFRFDEQKNKKKTYKCFKSVQFHLFFFISFKYILLFWKLHSKWCKSRWYGIFYKQGWSRLV